MTIWRSIRSFPNYEVSNEGQVRGLKGLLRPSLRNKYRTVLLRNGQIVKRVGIHVLVLEAFICPRPSGMHAMHLDDNSENNNLSNLAWGTPKENIQMRKHAIGERQGSSKLRESDVMEIRSLYGEYSTVELGEMFSVNHSTIARVVNRETWRHV